MEGNLFQLQGCLGYNKHHKNRPYVDNIKTRTNSKLNGKYVVGGSTYVQAFFGGRKRDSKQFHKAFKRYWNESCLNESGDVLEAKEAHLLVYGHLQSRSPLLQWSLLCSYKGFMPCEAQLRLCPEEETCDLGLNRKNRYCLLPRDECAFVFEIQVVQGPPALLSWAGNFISGGTHHNTYKGENLKRLGLDSGEKKGKLSRLDYQRLRFKVAKLGVEDKYGFNSLHLLHNRKLKNMLRTRRRIRGHLCCIEFPAYTFYGNAILEAARAHSKSSQWWEVVINFLPSYGQYLRDNRVLLDRLQKALKAETEVDCLFYGDFNDCWCKPPRQEQITDTLEHWEKFRPWFKIDGWRSRLSVYLKVYDAKQQFGDTAFSVTNMNKLIGAQEPENMLLYTTLENDKEYCFQSDWDTYSYFGKKCLQTNNVFYSGFAPLTAFPEGAVFVYPSHGVKRFYETRYKPQYSHVFETPYEYYVSTLHLIDARESLEKMFRKFKQDIVLVGMEYFPIDKVCFLLSQFSGIAFHFQYFQFDSICTTVKASYRLSPSFASFDLLPNFEYKKLEGVDNDIDELEMDSGNDLKTFFDEAKAKNYASRHGLEQGLQIVCFYKKCMEEAKKEYPRSYFRPDIKDKEALKTHFFIGDRVITSCGFIDYISNITYNGEPKQRIHQETYTGCGITLPGLPGRLFHATELKLAYILSHSQILYPIPNVMLFGLFPDYVREQYETFLCTENFLMHPTYGSQDTNLNEKFDRHYKLSKIRFNPLSGILFEWSKNKQAKEEEKAAMKKRSREQEKHDFMRAYVRGKKLKANESQCLEGERGTTQGME